MFFLINSTTCLDSLLSLTLDYDSVYFQFIRITILEKKKLQTLYAKRTLSIYIIQILFPFFKIKRPWNCIYIPKVFILIVCSLSFKICFWITTSWTYFWSINIKM